MNTPSQAFNQTPGITLCICTMNRPEELNQCLTSVFQSEEIPEEVIVSDDSPDSTAGQAITAQYPKVTYQIGPRRGLGSNRNACIRAAKSGHIIFIDDDVQVPPTFFQIARELIAISQHKIITGYELKYEGQQAQKVTPHNIDFWGLQRAAITKECCAIVINATIFPSLLFKQALFDEHLRYGSEEIDMACHAVSLGYQINYNEQLYVHHYPSSINREHYQRFINASRLYATAKAYWQYEKSILKTLAYIMLAPLQLLGSTVRRGRPHDTLAALQSIKLAWTYFLTHESK